MATTIVDRLMHHAHLLEFEGKSDRLQEAASRLTGLQARRVIGMSCLREFDPAKGGEFEMTNGGHLHLRRIHRTPSLHE
jgi:hypothetical protein